jgi:hypothetical protein
VRARGAAVCAQNGGVAAVNRRFSFTAPPTQNHTDRICRIA